MNDMIQNLENQLISFQADQREVALQELLGYVARGEIHLAPPNHNLNMHCHTFFSYNAYGHSPTSLVWLAKKMGWELIGIVDFDVLDGVEEFLNAGDFASVRTTTGIESRVYLPEFSTREINSPGEPGVAYHMGIGFSSGNVPDSVQHIAQDFRSRIAHRNQMVITRVNAFLDPIIIDYTQDVLPLSPAGTPTERHIVLAYVRATVQQCSDLVSFWSAKLFIAADQVESLLIDQAKFQNLVRTKLMKHGGPGYIQPTHETFPSIDSLNQLITACGALPAFAWLDGTSQGEQDIEELAELMISKGAVAINIIPDRNWNIADPELRTKKVSYLKEIITLAQQMDLPMNVGTEMNSPGNKLVDEFSTIELAPFHPLFLDGAYFVYGHTILQRAARLGYQSSWSNANFTSRRERNTFYTQVGKMVSPGIQSLPMIQALTGDLSPRQILQALSKL
jgi:hypothetical protein